MLKAISEEKIQAITTFIFDVDGVMTDGTIVALNSGEQPRTFYVKDGWAIVHALKKGYNVCIISGGAQEGTRKRLEFLGIKDIFLGVGTKEELFPKYCKEKGIDASQVLYMGDDIPDMEVMKMSGISTCPVDSAGDILEIADYISPKNGGKGAVREVIETVLKAQNNWI